MRFWTATAFWFFWATKVAVAYALFSTNPSNGALFNGAVTCLFLIAVALIALRRGRLQLLGGDAPMKMLVLHTLWAGVSILWTKADSTFVAAAFWLVGAAEIATVWLLCGLLSLRQRWTSALWGLSAGALCLAGAVFLTAQEMGDGRLGDFLLHPNTLGRQYAIAAIFAVMAWQGNLKAGRRLLLILLSVILTGLVLISLSKTNIAALAVALLVCLALGRVKSLASVLVVLSIPVIVAWPFVADYLATYESATGDAGETLSGRTLLWLDVWEMIQLNPLLGYGHAAFRDVGPDIFLVRMSHSHNEFLHQWFSYGLIGLVLAACAYMSAPFRLWRIRIAAKRSGNVLLSFQWRVGLAFLIFFVIRGLTEAGNELVFAPALFVLVMLGSRTAPKTGNVRWV